MLRCGMLPPMRSSAGTLFCLASGAAFGAMAIFGKLSYDEGVTVGTLLAVRFTVAATIFWTAVPLRSIRALRRREVGYGLALGACGYAVQAGLYFAALTRIEASLLAIVLYTFPVMVAGAAVAIGRERMDARRLAALGLSFGGLVLVVAGAGTGALDPLGVVLALGAATVYTAYILVSDRVVGRVAPQVLSTLVCTGAAVTLTIGTALLGQLHPGAVTLAGWGWLACLSVVSTVGAITLFFAGLRRVGPTVASILSTVEPLVTVLLAFLVFGERLGGLQLLGGTLVLSAVLALNWRVGAARRAAAALAPAGRT
jgi:drug/metabolite transporter (DMT)-like permease